MIIERDLAIPLPDGTRLSAKVWMPDDALENPVPAILEYLPYRKTDGTAERDATMHPHFASHGYCCLRVDRRGCGDSEGLFDDEYSEEEIQDGVDVIQWIAAQPWCTGAIGMQGISWGGFNGLQIAARAPDPLKAVISIGTTVDRYHDDIHYKGGVQLCENVGWAATVLSWFSMPPDPELRQGWREMWLERLENTPFLAETWTRHADRDGYWQHGSVCEDYAAIKAPVMVMGGLHDGYRNAMPALAANLSAPVRAITGPWSHKYPHITTIGPGLDYLSEALRWWDRWLKGSKAETDSESEFFAYVMDSCAPDSSLSHRAGTWVELDRWPPTDQPLLTLDLSEEGLGTAQPFSRTVQTDVTCGRNSGEFFPFGFGSGELPDDQTADNLKSACFLSDPLEEGLTILGRPNLTLRVSSDSPVGQVVARLCDHRPDGTSTLIALGILNLRHREGFDVKSDITPGQEMDVSLSFDHSAYRVPKGHRLCLAVSPSYWPYCWPEGRDVTLTLSAGRLNLPLLPEGARPVDFQPAASNPPATNEILRGGKDEKSWSVDETGAHVMTISGDHGRKRIGESGVIVESAVTETWSIPPGAPEKARSEIVWTRSFTRGETVVQSRAWTCMRGTADSFEIEQRLQAWDGDTEVFDKRWTATVPR